MTVAIIGLGLIGGSFARAIKERTKHRVLGFDRSERTLRAALQSDAVDAVCSNFKGVDLVLMALYPDATVEFVRQNAHAFHNGLTIIDLCGVKRCVCDGLRDALPQGINFIGGHPMAGRECSGFSNSTSGLFDGASMILTPEDDFPLEDMENLGEFFTSLGFGHIEITTPEMHDEMIAYTSQLAHIVSSAYVKNPIAKKYIGFSAGSFSDLTRVARLNEEMWAELFLHNADFLCADIDRITGHLSAFRDAVASGDGNTLRGLLREGREIKEALDAEMEIFR